MLFLAKLDKDNYGPIREALLNLFRRRLEVVIEESLLSFLIKQEQKRGEEHVLDVAKKQRTMKQSANKVKQQARSQKQEPANSPTSITIEKERAQSTQGPYASVLPAPERPPEFIMFHSDSKVDLVMTFGGDGLLLHCNTLFGERAVPPIMSFDFGSLGFLSPFLYENFDHEVHRCC